MLRYCYICLFRKKSPHFIIISPFCIKKHFVKQMWFVYRNVIKSKFTKSGFTGDRIPTQLTNIIHGRKTNKSYSNGGHVQQVFRFGHDKVNIYHNIDGHFPLCSYSLNTPTCWTSRIGSNSEAILGIPQTI